MRNIIREWVAVTVSVSIALWAAISLPGLAWAANPVIVEISSSKSTVHGVFNEQTVMRCMLFSEKVILPDPTIVLTVRVRGNPSNGTPPKGIISSDSGDAAGIFFVHGFTKHTDDGTATFEVNFVSHSKAIQDTIKFQAAYNPDHGAGYRVGISAPLNVVVIDESKTFDDICK
jgi:hypothetical protein